MEELQKHVESLRKEGASLKQQINQLQSDKDSNKAAMEKNTAEESRLTLHQNTVRLRLKQVDESRGEHAKSIQDINRETAQIKTQQEQIRQFRQQLTVQMDELEAKKKNAEELVTSLTAKLEEISEQERTSTVRQQICGFIMPIRYRRNLSFERVWIKTAAKSDIYRKNWQITVHRRLFSEVRRMQYEDRLMKQRPRLLL